MSGATTLSRFVASVHDTLGVVSPLIQHFCGTEYPVLLQIRAVDSKSARGKYRSRWKQVPVCACLIRFSKMSTLEDVKSAGRKKNEARIALERYTGRVSDDPTDHKLHRRLAED
jgi:hypothetical protein